MRKRKPWCGASDDAVPPPRVRLRIFQDHNGVCALTGRKIAPQDQWQLDHTVALVNGGKNEEANLRPVLAEAHKVKTAADVAEKAKVAAVASRHLGIKSRPTQLAGPDRAELDARKAARGAACGAKPGLPPRPLYI